MYHYLGIARSLVGHVYGSPAGVSLSGEAAVILAAMIDGPFALYNDN